MQILTNEELDDKIEWEGGLGEVIDWGLKPEEIYDEVAASIYAEAVAAYKVFDEIADKLHQRLIL